MEYATVLYAGLGLLVIGLVILLVGIGEKGYKTVELLLVGPILATVGLVVVISWLWQFRNIRRGTVINKAELQVILK